MKISFSHPTGNANVRAALKGFSDYNLLYVFHTSIATFSGDFLYKLSRLGPLAELRRRQFSGVLKSRTVMHPFIEAGRLLSKKFKLNLLTKHETGYFSIDKVYQTIDHAVAMSLSTTSQIDAVYAYEDAACDSFMAAKNNNIKCIYDLPIGYWRCARTILEAELLIRPEWACTLTGFKDSAKKLKRKDTELALADQIIVASSFTKKTLNDYPGLLAPITVIPYGFPEVSKIRTYDDLSKRPLRLLFVGGLSQRKGLANVFESVKGFGKKVCLTVVGQKVGEECVPLNEGLALHNWIPSLPLCQILELMHAHDVLVFPSLFEGFGLVITEAMSQGTPVITTCRTAGGDFIIDGVNGWLVEPGSSESLTQCIRQILSKPDLIELVGKEAMNYARNRPWDKYSQDLSSFIQSHV